MTTPAQTAPTLTSAALRAAKAVVVFDDERFTLGPCRLVVNVGKNGDRSYTVYSRRITKVPKTRPALDELLHAASEPHRFEAASALPERKDALAVMMRIAAMADSDVAEALEDIVEEHAQARARELYADERAAMLRLVRDNVEELPQDVGPVEAVPTTTDSADVLPMLRQALNVRPGSFTPAQLVEEVRLMREHADERYAQLKSLRQRLHLADSATKQAEQERDKALATLRQQAQAEAAHDNSTEHCLLTALAQRDALLYLCLDQQDLSLVEAARGLINPEGLKDDFERLQAHATIAALSERHPDNNSIPSARGWTRARDAMRLLFGAIVQRVRGPRFRPGGCERQNARAAAT